MSMAILFGTVDEPCGDCLDDQCTMNCSRPMKRPRMGHRITRVAQRGANDCGVAALAMACGVTYEQVEPIFANGSGDGVNDLHLKDWLIENGWAWQEVTRNHPVANRYEKRSPWPPKPFAPSHIVQVRATRDWHFTVMDEFGEIFDPWNADRKSLDHPDYQEVSWVMGLWRVSAPSATGRQGSETPSTWAK